MFTDVDVQFRFSLYPMADDYAEIILNHLEEIKPFNVDLETDDVSTLMTGKIDSVFGALEALTASVARTGVHFTVSGMFMVNCPTFKKIKTVPQKVVLPKCRHYVSSQFYIFPLGVDRYIDTVMDEVLHAHDAGLVKAEMHGSAGIHGELSDVLRYYKQALLRAKSHTFLQVTMSVNNPAHFKEQ